MDVRVVWLETRKKQQCTAEIMQAALLGHFDLTSPNYSWQPKKISGAVQTKWNLMQPSLNVMLCGPDQPDAVIPSGVSAL